MAALQDEPARTEDIIKEQQDENGVPGDLGPEESPRLSKNAMKKAARRERAEAVKMERRAREKASRKEKKLAIAAKRAAGELDEEDMPKPKKPRIVGPPFGGRVVVDLGFDEKMTEKEVQSLCSQLAYTYSANRQAGNPFKLLFTAINGKTKVRMDSLSDGAYQRWSHTESWEEGYERLWAEDPAVKDTVVYLTADSDVELTELKPDETYVIGGICDHNRLKVRAVRLGCAQAVLTRKEKNECYNKATASGIRHARLPIGTYLSELRTRKVLTVNQCFEILVQWVETRDWESAFYAVIPKRKFEEHFKNSQKDQDPAREEPADEDEVHDEGKLVLSIEQLEEPEVET
ncbi:unnamed protein product [Mycena citricolor]|uniref:tRNA (guanine(9)-N1)-methyltransferase n=1 Tax=Mycena citricolor TaxID=2018698 RepID=A0AAD2H2R2_9AGAR|nr:unnamed protein product [Mycena citricolor]